MPTTSGCSDSERRRRVRKDGKVLQISTGGPPVAAEEVATKEATPEVVAEPEVSVEEEEDDDEEE